MKTDTPIHDPPSATTRARVPAGGLGAAGATSTGNADSSATRFRTFLVTVTVLVAGSVLLASTAPLAGQDSPDARDGTDTLDARSAPSDPDERPAPVTVQPGAPGEPARTLDSAELAEMDRPGYTEADVRFVQGMIRHHAQALEMVDLLRRRSENDNLLQMGLRIEISQEDEIELMERWLRRRGEGIPAPASEEGTTGDGVEAGNRVEAGNGAPERNAPDTRDSHAPTTAGLPPGMLTPRQMASLEDEPDPTFELRFLELMIEHHEGALEMVDRLFGTPGAGQVPSVFHIAAEVQADQAMEIRRMREMLEEIDR